MVKKKNARKQTKNNGPLCCLFKGYVILKQACHKTAIFTIFKFKVILYMVIRGHSHRTRFALVFAL